MLTLNPTVFLVDRDAAARNSLATLVRNAGWEAEFVESAELLLTRAPLRVASCLILDIGLPDLTGLTLLPLVAAERKETPVIATASHGDIPMTVRAMKAGAIELLVKPFGEDAMLGAIHYALARSRALLERAAELRELRRRYELLSRREREVMIRVVAGDLNKHIGAALGISEITVKAHRGKVMRKMRAESLAELVSVALRLDLPTAHTTPPAVARSVCAGFVMTRLTPLDGPQERAFAAAH